MTAPLEIPGYKIESVLGEGGMATVYLSIQESLERKVALKVMNSSLLVDKTFCERFLTEGKTVARLRHPSIVNIYDIGCHDSIYYMAMEYVEGGSLTDRLTTSIGAQEALNVTRSIAGALGYAHLHGFIHRDIKPANILFREGNEATLTDFGIAKALESDKQLTQMGYAIGTPEYMSPEQARAAELDGRSDLYSLGIVLYEMLTGQRPFTSGDAFATALMHLNQPVPALPEHLAIYQPIIDRLLAKNPDDRFEDARQLIQALDSMAGNRTIEYGVDPDDKTLIAPSSRVYDPATMSDSAVGAAIDTRVPKNTVNGAAEALTAAATLARQAETASASVPPDAERKSPSPWRVAAPVAVLSVLTLAGLGFYFYSDSLNTMPEVAAVKTTATVPALESSAPDTDTASQGRIKRLLQGAAAHMAIGRLREPPGANAYEAYQMVLGMDPDNLAARQGIQEIEQMEPSN